MRIRLKDAQTRFVSAELQLGGSSPHEWKHAAEIAVSSGIAASDAICGHVLGYKVASESHRDALEALRLASSASIALRGREDKIWAWASSCDESTPVPLRRH